MIRKTDNWRPLRFFPMDELDRIEPSNEAFDRIFMLANQWFDQYSFQAETLVLAKLVSSIAWETHWAALVALGFLGEKHDGLELRTILQIKPLLANESTLIEVKEAAIVAICVMTRTLARPIEYLVEVENCIGHFMKYADLASDFGRRCIELQRKHIQMRRVIADCRIRSASLVMDAQFAEFLRVQLKDPMYPFAQIGFDSEESILTAIAVRFFEHWGGVPRDKELLHPTFCGPNDPRGGFNCVCESWWTGEPQGVLKLVVARLKGLRLPEIQ